MLAYAKAHACGNDFLIVEVNERVPRDEQQQRALAVALCARTTGVGADGVEFFSWTGEPTSGEPGSLSGSLSGVIRLRNADGGIAEISGNGTRCVAAWMAHTRGAQVGARLVLETDAGQRVCVLEQRDGVRMLLRSAMGVPTVEAARVKLMGGGMVEGAVVSTGNPHFVVRVEDASFQVQGLDWRELGKAICLHPQFPEQTNVEFVQLLSAGEIAIRIFERGVGPTSSSGTGTCATAAAAMRLYGCARALAVHAPGGTQQVHWPSDAEQMELTGPAELIAVGAAFVTANGGNGLA